MNNAAYLRGHAATLNAVTKQLERNSSEPDAVFSGALAAFFAMIFESFKINGIATAEAAAKTEFFIRGYVEHLSAQECGRPANDAAPMQTPTAIVLSSNQKLEAENQALRSQLVEARKRVLALGGMFHDEDCASCWGKPCNCQPCSMIRLECEDIAKALATTSEKRNAR